jgi:sodium-dependent phosphate transporter
MALEQFNYIFVIGTFFAMLDAYNNGASERLTLFRGES